MSLFLLADKNSSSCNLVGVEGHVSGTKSLLIVSCVFLVASKKNIIIKNTKKLNI